MKQEDRDLLNNKPSLNCLLRTQLAQWAETPVIKYTEPSGSITESIERIHRILESVFNRVMVFDKVSEDVKRIHLYHEDLKRVTDFVHPVTSNYNLYNDGDLKSLSSTLNETRTDYTDSLFSNGLYTNNLINFIIDMGGDIEQISGYVKLLWRSILMDTINPVGRRSKREREREMIDLMDYPLFGHQNVLPPEEVLVYASEIYDFVLDAKCARIVPTTPNNVSWVNGKSNSDLISTLQNVLNPSTLLRLKGTIERIESQLTFELRNDKITEEYQGFLNKLETILYILQYKSSIMVKLLRTVATITYTSFNMNWKYLCNALPKLDSDHAYDYSEIIRTALENILESEDGCERIVG